MATLAHAHLAYGYDLGDDEGWHVTAPLDEHGGLAAPWWNDGGEEGNRVEAATQIYDALYAAIPDAPTEPNPNRRAEAAKQHYGVEITFTGNDRFEGWLLIAVGSEQIATNAGSIVLNLHDMEHPPNEWFHQLTDAIETLGISPAQDWPHWLVFPSYG